jgi:predicted Zn-dependent protease with MMP-like domain
LAPPDYPPTLEDLETLASNVIATLPAPFRNATGPLPILIEEFPSEEVLKEMGLVSPFDILGLYQGVDLRSKSTLDAPGDIDRVFLYRRPILDYWCETGEALPHIVSHVLIHEIGHHFGLSDADMAAIEAEAE